ncbi:SDR family NAD(P)-dependent oxidoreductase [Phytohabitans flavus]|nr:glucose 1-dehydrogenase [Phytohabitans flavus]
MAAGLFDLSGKLALVTGGARGLGRVAAEAFAAHGARVVLLDRLTDQVHRTAEELSAAGYEAHAIAGDLTDADVRRRVRAATDSLGSLDVLVNAAGVVRRKDIRDTTVEDLDWLWAVNVRGLVALTQEYLRDMIARRQGKIINLASLGSRIGLERRTAYAVTKGAVAQYTVSLASEVGKHGICVNAVAPGYVDTDMTADWLWGDKDRTDAMLNRIPLGYFARPEQLAGVFVFLAAPASDYLTGQIVVVDGGWTSQ